MKITITLKNLTAFVLFLVSGSIFSQNQMVTYAGHESAEKFNEVTQLSNGHFIVAGSAENLNWISASVPFVTLSHPGISNPVGSSKIAFILEFDEMLQVMLKIYRLPVGVAEDFRFIKLTNLPGQHTGAICLSGSTSTGYFIGKLNDNLIEGSPTGFSCIEIVAATTGEYPKIYQPWDIGGDAKVIYATGDSHSWNWSAIYRFNADGTDDVVNNWRVH